MTIKDYIHILSIGYKEYRNYLSKYLIRESKEAEKKFIDNEEFFDGLNKVIKLFYTDIDNQYYDEKNKVSMIKSIRLEKGQSVEDLEAKSKEYFHCHLFNGTNNVFSNLPFHEIQFLEMAVNEAKQTLNHDNKSQSGTASKGEIIEYDLTNFQTALMQWHLEKYTKEPNKIPCYQGKQIVEIYGRKRVETELNAIRKYYDKYKSLNTNRRNFKTDLIKVKNHLSDFPEIQMLITNSLYQLE